MSVIMLFQPNIGVIWLAHNSIQLWSSLDILENVKYFLLIIRVNTNAMHWVLSTLAQNCFFFLCVRIHFDVSSNDINQDKRIFNWIESNKSTRDSQYVYYWECLTISNTRKPGTVVKYKVISLPFPVWMRQWSQCFLQFAEVCQWNWMIHSFLDVYMSISLHTHPLNDVENDQIFNKKKSEATDWFA